MTPAMARKPHDDRIALHVGSIANRSEHEARRLAAAVADRCWNRYGERSVPAAREWLRLWGPERAATTPPTCSCRVGRCMLCN
jgi:hypothetical protein